MHGICISKDLLSTSESKSRAKPIDYIVLGTVHSDLIRLKSTKQVKESIESLICHLETFSKGL